MYYIPFSPHNICGSIGTVAASHVCAAVPNFQVLEFHHLDNELWSNLTVGDNLIELGHLSVPTDPGLGVALDETVAKDATVEDLEFFE